MDGTPLHSLGKLFEDELLKPRATPTSSQGDGSLELLWWGHETSNILGWDSLPLRTPGDLTCGGCQKLQGWIISGDAHLSKVDLCSYNMRSIDEQFRLLKPITLLCSNEIFAEKISRLCTKDHEHVPIQGQNTAHSGIYTTAFSNAVVRAYDEAERCEKAYPTQTLRGRERSRARSRDTRQGRRAEPVAAKGRSTLSSLQRWRESTKTLGILPTESSIRHLKIGGAPPAVLHAAERFVCRTCEKSSKARPHKISNPVVALDFNEVVAADIIWVDTADARNKPALNVVELASTYQVVIPLPGDQVRGCFLFWMDPMGGVCPNNFWWIWTRPLRTSFWPSWMRSASSLEQRQARHTGRTVSVKDTVVPGRPFGQIHGRDVGAWGGVRWSLCSGQWCEEST